LPAACFSQVLALGFKRRLVAQPAWLVVCLLVGCSAESPGGPPPEAPGTAAPRPEIYAEFALTADLGFYSDNQRKMIAVLLEAAELIDDLFWKQTYGYNYSQWLASIDDDDAHLFAVQNYGPWDRLDQERPFIDGAGPKPPGANFYPVDLSEDEFNAAYLPGKAERYSLVRRNEQGALILVPYQVAFADELKEMAGLLRSAAGLADSAEFATYLKLRANALLSDDFTLSDMFWMDVNDNEIDIVIGPIETHEDRLFGYRAAYQSVVVLKDLEWSAQLAMLADLLPELQESLPVPFDYRRDLPTSNADLNAYDVIRYAGYSNVGTKATALSLPDDQELRLQKGTRRMLLKNAMRAKFETILEPIADVLIEQTQRQHVNFNAHFANAMFHEVAHGLGPRNTVNDKGTVTEALRDVAATVEEGKADILALYIVTALHDAGELDGPDLQDYYVSAMAAALQSAYFEAGDARAAASMLRFNDFVANGAYVRDAGTGRYRVDIERMPVAIERLARRLLMLQGDGRYDDAVKLQRELGVVSARLQADLERLVDVNVPLDVSFNQGAGYLGLEN
jgi:hypothetical protein